VDIADRDETAGPISANAKSASAVGGSNSGYWEMMWWRSLA